MYAIYGNIYHQYTPVMLAYIPAPWILWDIYIERAYSIRLPRLTKSASKDPNELFARFFKDEFQRHLAKATRERAGFLTWLKPRGRWVGIHILG